MKIYFWESYISLWNIIVPSFNSTSCDWIENYYLNPIELNFFSQNSCPNESRSRRKYSKNRRKYFFRIEVRRQPPRFFRQHFFTTNQEIMSLISCPSRTVLGHFFAIHGHCSRELIQRMVPCVTNNGSHRGARWTKPWKVGDPKLWAKGVMDCEFKNY